MDPATANSAESTPQVSASDVVRYVCEHMTSEITNPEKITVQQVSPLLYAVRIYERSGNYDAFFLQLTEEGESATAP